MRVLLFSLIFVIGCDENLFRKSNEVNLTKVSGKVTSVDIKFYGKSGTFWSIINKREDLEKTILDLEDFIVDLKRAKEQMPINENILEFKSEN